jgi:HTH-type transcriptional regulator/antitoxin HigA
MARVRQYSLRAIRTETDYQAAVRVLDELILRDDLDPGERDYLGALELLIEAFDIEHFPDAPDDRPPHQRLKALMDSSGTTASNLQEILGASQTLVSLMLNGRRELSKRTIAKLAKHFRVDPGYFL